MMARIIGSPRLAVVLVACAVGIAAGAARARAQCTYIPGIGKETSCQNLVICGYDEECVQYECAGMGQCGPNGGQDCLYYGCTTFSYYGYCPGECPG